MIKGIGIDVCHVARIEKALQNPRFTEKVFTESEKDHASRHGRKARHLAAAFAAKEAFAKAGRWGLGKTGLLNISLERENGVPCIRLSGNAEALFISGGGSTVHVSITHDGDLAIAVVVIEG